ncbi:unnamed protein product, partial [Amoebophrya sp. A120]
PTEQKRTGFLGSLFNAVFPGGTASTAAESNTGLKLVDHSSVATSGTVGPSTSTLSSTSADQVANSEIQTTASGTSVPSSTAASSASTAGAS